MCCALLMAVSRAVWVSDISNVTPCATAAAISTERQTIVVFAFALALGFSSGVFSFSVAAVEVAFVSRLEDSFALVTIVT